MDRDQVIQILRVHEAELRAAGVEHLRLFGSVARGDQTPESDIDLAAEMSASTKWSPFSLGGVQMDLSEWLGVKVDLSLLTWLRPPLRERILLEAVDAFRDYPQYLKDIATSIAYIEAFLDDMTPEEVHADRKTVAAVERELGIITEAAARLDDKAEQFCPGPDWRNIRGFGNILRHAYDHIDPESFWRIVRIDLPPLKKDVSAALARISR